MVAYSLSLLEDSLLRNACFAGQFVWKWLT